MKKLLLPCVVVCPALATCGTVAAQVPYTPPMTSPFYHPPVSPYINLLRAGSSPAVNLYGVVRPQLQFYSAANAFQEQINTNQVGIAGLQQGMNAAVTTGHGVAFLNTGGYFLSLGRPGQSGLPRGSTGIGTGLTSQSTNTALNRPAGATTGVGARPTVGGSSMPGIGTGPTGR
jgi:hypothetical protein